jgi:hypothetical protein
MQESCFKLSSRIPAAALQRAFQEEVGPFAPRATFNLSSDDMWIVRLNAINHMSNIETVIRIAVHRIDSKCSIAFPLLARRS